MIYRDCQARISTPDSYLVIGVARDGGAQDRTHTMTSHQEVAYTHIFNRDLMAVRQHDQRAGGAAPAPMELRTPEALRLGCGYTLNE